MEEYVVVVNIRFNAQYKVNSDGPAKMSRIFRRGRSKTIISDIPATYHARYVMGGSGKSFSSCRPPLAATRRLIDVLESIFASKPRGQNNNRRVRVSRVRVRLADVTRRRRRTTAAHSKSPARSRMTSTANNPFSAKYIIIISVIIITVTRILSGTVVLCTRGRNASARIKYIPCRSVHVLVKYRMRSRYENLVRETVLCSFNCI